MTVLLSSGRARRAASLVVLSVGLATVLTACGENPDAGTNGLGKLSAARIERAAQTAVDAAGAVRLSGELVSQGQTYKLNMRLRSGGGVGSVTSSNSTFELLRIKDTLYLRADAGFWSPGNKDGAAEDSEAAGGGERGAGSGAVDSEAAEKLDDKYVKVPVDDPSYKQLRGFTEMKVLLDGLLALPGPLDKGRRDRIGGVRTIKVRGGKGAGGTLDVSLEGTPYPLQLERAGGAGTLTLTDWGMDFPLEAPAKDRTVDYGNRLPRTSD